MNSEADFVRALVASPRDTTLPLAFADWLEEQGDPRAAWVRHPAVRPWMGPGFADPVPAVVEAVRRKRRLIDARRAAAAIGAPAAMPLAALLTHEDAAVRLQVTRCLRGMKKAAEEAVPALLAALKDADRSVRDQAAKALKDIGAKGASDTSSLRDALTDESWDVRRRAAEALAAMGAKRAVVEELAGRLADADAAVRRVAVESLGQLKNRSVVAPLCRALADGDAGVRQEAAEQLSEVLGPGMSEAVAPLRRALADGEAAVRRAAALALSRLGRSAGEAIGDLLAALRDGDVGLRALAARALGLVASGDEGAVAPLLEAAGDRHSEVSGAALLALGKWDHLPARARRPLLAGLRRHAGHTYHLAELLLVLARLPALTPDALALLRAALRRPGENYLADRAGEVLRRFGPAGAAAIPELVAVLRQPWPPVGPAWALAAMGEAGVGELVDLLSDSSEGARLAALSGLVKAGPAAAVALPRLRALLRRAPQDWRLINGVVEVLAAIGVAAAEALPELLALLRDHRTAHTRELNAALRAITPALGPHVPALAEALGELGSCASGHVALILARLSPRHEAAWAALGAGLRQAAPAEADGERARWDKAHTRGAVADALAEAEPASAVAELLPLLDDPTGRVSCAAAASLGKLRAAVAVDPLRRLLASKDEARRAAAATALGRIGPPAAGAGGDLAVALSDAVPAVRAAAVAALAAVGDRTGGTLTALRQAARDADKAVARAAAAALKQLGPRPRG